MKLINFYYWANLPEYKEISCILKKLCSDLVGTIILADEGVNASLAGDKQRLFQVADFFTKDTRFADMKIKVREIDKIPFKRMKIKCKKEIITFFCKNKLPNLNYSFSEKSAQSLNPQEWNKLIKDKNTIILDIRNEFECKMGSFPNAINPHIKYFSEMAEYINKHKEKLKNRSVAIFCTGGIRCEKLRPYMLSEDIQNVYQLKGGILEYLERVNPNNNLWQRECFVFDERVSVKSN